MLRGKHTSLAATALLLILNAVASHSESFSDWSDENTIQKSNEDSNLSTTSPDMPIEVEENDPPKKNLPDKYAFDTDRDEKIAETRVDEENQPKNIQRSEIDDNNADLLENVPSDEASFTDEHIENLVNQQEKYPDDIIFIPPSDIKNNHTDNLPKKENITATEIQAADNNPNHADTSNSLDLLNDAPVQEADITNENLTSEVKNENNNSFSSDNRDVNQNVSEQSNIESKEVAIEENPDNLESDTTIDILANYFNKEKLSGDKLDEIREHFEAVNQDDSDKIDHNNEKSSPVEDSAGDTDVPAPDSSLNKDESHLSENVDQSDLLLKNEDENKHDDVNTDVNQNVPAQLNFETKDDPLEKKSDNLAKEDGLPEDKSDSHIDRLANFFHTDDAPNEKNDEIQTIDQTDLAEKLNTDSILQDKSDKIDDGSAETNLDEASAVDTDVPATDVSPNKQDGGKDENKDENQSQDGGNILNNDNDGDNLQLLTKSDTLQTVEDTDASKNIKPDETAQNYIDVFSLFDDAKVQSEEKSPETPPLKETNDDLQQNSSDEKKCPPECVCEFKSADYVSIDCTERSLSEIPSDLDEGVTNLSLGKNNITHIPSNFAERFSNLKAVSLEENNIKYIELGAFHGPLDLQSIYLNDNELTEVPEEVTSLINIQILNLKGNPIDETTPIKANYFSQLAKIRVLNLPKTTQNSLLNELCGEHNTLATVFIGDEEHHCADLPSETDIIPKASRIIELNAEQEVSTTSSTAKFEGPSLLDDIHKQNSDIEGSIKSFLETVPGQIDTGLGKAEDFIQKQLDQATKATDGAIEKVLQETSKAIKAVNEQTGEKLIAAIDDATVAKGNSHKAVEDTNKAVDAIRSNIENNNIPKAVLLGFGLPINTSLDESKLENDTDTSDTTDDSGQLSPTVETIGQLSEKQSEDLKAGDGIPVTGGETAAAKANAGGGVDNVVIGLVVAGMLCVVAGVAVKKNWTKITRPFKRSPPAQAVATNGHGPHEPEEAEPLRDDKSPV